MRTVLLALLIAGVATADEPPAVAAAGKRQDALPSVEFNVRVKRAEPTTVRLVVDGPKARFERHVTNPPKRSWVATNDGTRAKVCLQIFDPVTGGANGDILPASSGICQKTEYLPLTLAARGLERLHCPVTADTLTPAGTAEVRGRVCDAYTGTLDGVAGTFWFDPAAGHTLRRMKLGVTAIDVESSNANPAGVWLPASYTLTRTPAGRPPEVEEFTVERVEIGKDYPAAEFDPPWPAGVLVHDAVSNGTFVSDADGELQRVDDRRMWEWVIRLWWVPVAFVALTAGLVGWRMWRRRKAAA